MSQRWWMIVPGLLLSIALGTLHGANGDAPKKGAEPVTCAAAVDNFFVDDVWAKVGSQICLTCHKSGGDAAESALVLQDPRRIENGRQHAALEQNREAFTRLAKAKEGNDSRLLLKVAGKLDHGGKDVLPVDSTGYRVLAEFVRRVNNPTASKPRAADVPLDAKARPFFENVELLDAKRLLRRVTLSLAGRLPSEAELAKAQSAGLPGVRTIVADVLKEDAFYDRLREAFNDIFLTVGVSDGAETVLSYDHFSTTRLWYQKHDLSHIKDEKERRQAGYKLADDYRKAILGEPMKLVEHIVRNDKPFTEIITADYIMVTPYSARGYGIYDEVKDRFKNTDDPFEYIPVRIKALIGRNKPDNQESKSGFYPHAGLLSTFQYLRRYPTTETNRNRLRARMYFQHFLGVDALELAARVGDAAAVTAKFETPTMQAAECVVCHKTIDPIASLFQDYYRFEGVFGRRKEGWYKDMFQAGYEEEAMPAEERWRALQWLGEQTIKDPRFAVAMVEHVYYVLTGRKVLLPPKQIDDPLYAAKQRAYREQRSLVEAIASKFAAEKFNLKVAFQEWIFSDFYRADRMQSAIDGTCRVAELDDIGLARLLSPEQVERKVGAVFGERWGRLNDQLAMLYGGIDSKEVTERASDPSGAMGAIQRILSNDVACKQTARDFAKPANERKLFPHIEPNVTPGVSREGDQMIRKAMVHLHERILGRYDAVDSEEIDRTWELFTGIISDAQAAGKGLEKRESYHCRQGAGPADDPNYTIRAWRGVVTYLLRRQEFFYE